MFGFTKPEAVVSEANPAEEQRTEQQQQAGCQLYNGDDHSPPLNQEIDGVGRDAGFKGYIKSTGEEDEPPNGNKTADTPSECTMRSGRHIPITERACKSNYQCGKNWVAW